MVVKAADFSKNKIIGVDTLIVPYFTRIFNIHLKYLCYDETMKLRRGFTLVELLVVIVVLAILVSIVVVSYASIQKRARDEVRKQDVASFAKGIELYNSDNGPMYTSSGCGSGGNGSGWINYTYSGYNSIATCLLTAKSLKVQLLTPSKTNSCSAVNTSCDAYMKYTCTQSGRTVTYVYANLETVPRTATATDGTCDATIDSNYGMNYFVKVTER